MTSQAEIKKFFLQVPLWNIAFGLWLPLFNHRWSLEVYLPMNHFSCLDILSSATLDCISHHSLGIHSYSNRPLVLHITWPTSSTFIAIAIIFGHSSSTCSIRIMSWPCVRVSALQTHTHCFGYRQPALECKRECRTGILCTPHTVFLCWTWSAIPEPWHRIITHLYCFERLGWQPCEQSLISPFFWAIQWKLFTLAKESCVSTV